MIKSTRSEKRLGIRTVEEVENLIKTIALVERPQSFGEEIANSVSHGVVAHKREWG